VRIKQRKTVMPCPKRNHIPFAHAKNKHEDKNKTPRVRWRKCSKTPIYCQPLRPQRRVKNQRSKAKRL